jgi:hypothetical protein
MTSVERVEYGRACELLAWDKDVGRPLPSWFCWPLVATIAAREKLRRFAKEVAEPWVTPDTGRLLTTLETTGDVFLPYTLAKLVAGLPPPVAAYVDGNVSFACIGLQTIGWCGPPVVTKRPWQVFLSAATDDGAVENFRALAAHEIAHAWLLPEPAPDVRAAGSFWHKTIHHTPIDQVPDDAREAVMREREQYRQDELDVLALTRRWGFRDLGTEARTW